MYGLEEPNHGNMRRYKANMFPILSLAACKFFLQSLEENSSWKHKCPDKTLQGASINNKFPRKNIVALSNFCFLVR